MGIGNKLWVYESRLRQFAGLGEEGARLLELVSRLDDAEIRLLSEVRTKGTTGVTRDPASARANIMAGLEHRGLVALTAWEPHEAFLTLDGLRAASILTCCDKVRCAGQTVQMTAAQWAARARRLACPAKKEEIEVGLPEWLKQINAQADLLNRLAPLRDELGKMEERLKRLRADAEELSRLGATPVVAAPHQLCASREAFLEREVEFHRQRAQAFEDAFKRLSSQLSQGGIADDRPWDPAEAHKRITDGIRMLMDPMVERAERLAAWLAEARAVMGFPGRFLNASERERAEAMLAELRRLVRAAAPPSSNWTVKIRHYPEDRPAGGGSKA